MPIPPCRQSGRSSSPPPNRTAARSAGRPGPLSSTVSTASSPSRFSTSFTDLPAAAPLDTSSSKSCRTNAPSARASRRSGQSTVSPVQQTLHPLPQIPGEGGKIHRLRAGRPLQPGAQLHPAHDPQHPADPLVQGRQIAFAFLIPSAPLQKLAGRRHLGQLNPQLGRRPGRPLFYTLPIHPWPPPVCLPYSYAMQIWRRLSWEWLPHAAALSNFVEFFSLYQTRAGIASNFPGGATRDNTGQCRHILAREASMMYNTLIESTQRRMDLWNKLCVPQT